MTTLSNDERLDLIEKLRFYDCGASFERIKTATDAANHFLQATGCSVHKAAELFGTTTAAIFNSAQYKKWSASTAYKLAQERADTGKLLTIKKFNTKKAREDTKLRMAQAVKLIQMTGCTVRSAASMCHLSHAQLSMSPEYIAFSQNRKEDSRV